MQTGRAGLTLCLRLRWPAFKDCEEFVTALVTRLRGESESMVWKGPGTREPESVIPEMGSIRAETANTAFPL